jgi:lysyl-tRNA synthetase class I
MIVMVKCPNCGKQSDKPKKKWKYGPFEVHAYSCDCGNEFREYVQEGKHSFTLKLKKGKGFVKA